MIRDGHVHTPYCPHGTKDTLEAYVEMAISLGYKTITFAEHAPLPAGFTDAAPTRDSAMDNDMLEEYFADLDRVKRTYTGKIIIYAGLEIDYIEGFEEQTTAFLNRVGPRLDDAILSVHFLQNTGVYDCLDYSPGVFGSMAERYGSTEMVHERYYQTVLKSILADMGPYKPRRIGHMTLACKFQLKYPSSRCFQNEITAILSAISQKGYELDYNGAGTAKPLCREPYPPDWIVKEAVRLGIPLVYGSDAHQAKELGQGLSAIDRTVLAT
ncbi:histidinol-phosphatase HisJ [Bacillus sp. T33-2]|uniref:histidinol-phosphatase HisJ n=1 Tax=Bacillus sp. T33-2 TaxID=2054168 RepID=UPI000C767065|nr:histidinol-phosphatase HisJ [Bacillus sp. T33-2]PLR98156.1 histidinol phosphatase [Bacillus sp. T33-2]